MAESANATTAKATSKFVSISGLNALPALITPLLFLLTWVFLWSGPVVSSAFGHVFFSAFEKKISLLVLTLFLFYLLFLSTNSTFSTSESFDFLITTYHLTYWLPYLFLATNILSLSLVIEVLTGLVTLFLVTSYNGSSNHTLSNPSHDQLTSLTHLPTTFLYSLLTFFWTSLVTTLILFLFVLLFYSKFLTLEWSLINPLSSFIVHTATTHEISVVSFSWSFVLLCIFLKCAITPFYLWKPTFFKGISFTALLYYVLIYYFTIFLYFVYLMMSLFSDLFFLNTILFLTVMLVSLALLPSLLYETINVKSFFAVSSVINSTILLLVTLAISNENLIPLL